MTDKPKRARRANVRPRNEFTDDVFTIRLNKGNEDEARALAILSAHLKKVDASGRHYSPRYVITQALLALDGVDLPDPQAHWSGMDALAEMFGARFDELAELVAGLRELGFQQVAPPKKQKKKSVPAGYLSNLTNALKRGQPEDEER